VYYYNVAQTYELFLQVGRLYRALILLGLAFCLPSSFVLDLHGAIYIYFFFFEKKIVYILSLPFIELSLVRLALDLVD